MSDARSFGEFAKAVESLERVLAAEPALAQAEGVAEDLGRAKQLAAQHGVREAERVEQRHGWNVAHAAGGGGAAAAARGPDRGGGGGGGGGGAAAC